MAQKKLAKVQDIPGMKIYDGPDGPDTLKDNINKISLRELGLGDDVDIRIWEAVLPELPF